jgi:hypothetical protein
MTISTMLRRTARRLWPRTPSDSAAVTCSATGRFTPVSGSASRNSSSTPTVNAAGSTAAVEPAAVAKVDATGHRPSSGKHRCGDGGTPGYPATLRANTPVPRATGDLPFRKAITRPCTGQECRQAATRSRPVVAAKNGPELGGARLTWREG